MKQVPRQSSGPAQKFVVVNSDDFGLSAEVNHATIRAFAEGLISRTSILANLPGFQEACELAHRHQLYGRVGLHLNMTQGRPLTTLPAILPSLCDGSGNFLPPRRRLWLTRREAAALELEFEAQLQACLRNGLKPSHLNSHHDMHVELAITPIVIRIARRHGVPAVRIASRKPSIARLFQFQRSTCNRRLRAAGLAKTQYFGDCDEIKPVLGNSGSVYEVIVHARLNESGELVDLGGANLRQRLGGLQTPCLPISCAEAPMTHYCMRMPLGIGQ